MKQNQHGTKSIYLVASQKSILELFDLIKKYEKNLTDIHDKYNIKKLYDFLEL